MSEWLEKALLDEGMASCDKCGFVAARDEFYSFYYNIIGERLDLCERCFLDYDDGWGEKW
jgi:hypothetical protein